MNYKPSQKWSACRAGDCPLRFAPGMGLPKQTHVLRSDFPKGMLRDRREEHPPRNDVAVFGIATTEF